MMTFSGSQSMCACAFYATLLCSVRSDFRCSWGTRHTYMHVTGKLNLALFLHKTSFSSVDHIFLKITDAKTWTWISKFYYVIFSNVRNIPRNIFIWYGKGNVHLNDFFVMIVVMILITWVLFVCLFGLLEWYTAMVTASTAGECMHELMYTYLWCLSKSVYSDMGKKKIAMIFIHTLL